MRCGGHQLSSALKSNRVNRVIVRFIVSALGVLQQRADMAALQRPVAELALTIKRGVKPVPKPLWLLPRQRIKTV